MPVNKVYIVTCEPFPNGMAATNRIVCYGKGLFVNGIECEVTICRATEQARGQVLNTSCRGDYQSIEYFYPGLRTVRSENFLRRRWYDFLSFIQSWLYLAKRFTKEKTAALIVYLHSPVLEFFFVVLAKSLHILVLKEESENYETRYANKNRIFRWYYYYINYRLYDRVLCMTTPIKTLLAARGVADGNLVLVPQTVDLARFAKKNCLGDRYIAFCGSYKQSKDGVLSLVEVFGRIAGRFPEVILKLAGSGSHEDTVQLYRLISKLGLEDRIIDLGRLSVEDVSTLLVNASLLVSLRPYSKQAEYGFPTKIAEFLCTGVPVITSAFGDLTSYLKDGENCLVVDPSDYNDICQKIQWVFQNPALAADIADRGMALARKSFDPVHNVRKIIEILDV